VHVTNEMGESMSESADVGGGCNQFKS
jgi:hypothetical protein